MNRSFARSSLSMTSRGLLLITLAFVLAGCPRSEEGRTPQAEPTQQNPAAEAPSQATAAPTATSTGIPVPVPYAQVTTSALNVRSGPGTVYDQIGVVFESDQLVVLGQVFECGWLLILTPAGLEGWVSSAYVDLALSCTDLAAATIPATPTAGPIATLAQADTPTPTRPPETPSPTLASADTPTPTPQPGTATPTPTPPLATADTPTPTPTSTPTLASPDTPTPTRPVEPTEQPPAVPAEGTVESLIIQPLQPGDLQVPLPIGTVAQP